MKAHPRSSWHHLSCHHFTGFPPLCLDFLRNLHLSLVSRLWWRHVLFKHFKSINIPSILAMTQCNGPKAYCGCGAMKFVRPLWFFVSKAFHEAFWGVSLGRSVGSRKWRRKRRPYFEHRNFPGFVNPDSSICVFYSLALRALPVFPLIEMKVCWWSIGSSLWN